MKAPSVKPVRCAIYTRVSTDHGVRDPAYGHRPGRRVVSFNRTAIEPIRY